MAAMQLPSELKAKLAPLLRLQSSSNDGERANASAAIGRLLARYNLDWHDLTELLLAEPAPPIAPAPPPDTSWKRSSGAKDLPRKQLLILLDSIERRRPFLPIKSAGFVSSLRNYHCPVVHLSERQWAWLQDLLVATGV